MNLSSAFFRASTDALLENSTLRLCKLYDKDPKAISLYKYLRKVASEPTRIFPNRQELNQEASVCTSLITREESTIDLLRNLRDNFLAHNDKSMLNIDPFAKVGLTIGQYRSFITLAGAIVNRIRRIFKRSHLLFYQIDDDDYKYLLIAITEYTKEHPEFFEIVKAEKDTKEKQIAMDALAKV